MDLNRVVAFVRVVEASSFTAAAEALGVPKSSVSRSVSNLEAELGVRLLQRTTRKLALTEAGRAYFERARQALLGLEEAHAVVVDHGTELRGPIRVTAPGDIGDGFLAGLFAEFTREHPEVRIEIVITPRRVDLVAEGFDLAVRAGVLEDSSLVARRVGTTALGLFASKEYLDRRGRPTQPEDLAEHDCVLLRGQRGRATWLLEGPEGSTSVDVRGPLSADDMAFVHAAVAAGAGISLLPVFLCAVPVNHRRLPVEHVLTQHRVRGGDLSIVSPPKDYEPARVTLLREHLVRGLARLPWEGHARCPNAGAHPGHGDHEASAHPGGHSAPRDAAPSAPTAQEPAHGAPRPAPQRARASPSKMRSSSAV